ncbi:O-antigen ligase family protein [Patescibacteria group bacterium]|nr:O-antigen ligase family protein [Patescibacteria group bacterium]
MTKKALNLWLISLAITLLLALAAELYRFHGYLLLDLFVPPFVATYLFFALLRKKLRLPETFLPAAVFVLIGFASLLINSLNFTQGEFISAAFYCVRWASYFLLSVVVLNESRQKQSIFNLLIIFVVLLSIAGFIQLKIMPDFTSFEEIGWDPHQNRLLATWFDPNFVGGFLAFMLPITLSVALEKKRSRALLLPAAAVMLFALILTLSRSSYLALAAGILVLGLLRSWRIIAFALVVAVLTTLFAPPVQTRVLNLYQSVTSVFSETYTLPDPSARLRLDSWREALILISEKPILGHGYNAYEKAALASGAIESLEAHSASGSDSSLLTILATTGVLGFLPFLSIYLLLAFQAWQTRSKGFSAGFLAALTGLAVHSIFVNSLLFPLFMAPFWIAAGLLPRKTKPGHTVHYKHSAQQHP